MSPKEEDTEKSGLEQKTGGTNFQQRSGTDWKFIAPADGTDMVTFKGTQCLYCKYYLCKKTKRKFFNHTHTSTTTSNNVGYTFPRTDNSTAVTEVKNQPFDSTISSLRSSSSPECSLGVIMSSKEKLLLS